MSEHTSEQNATGKLNVVSVVLGFVRTLIFVLLAVLVFRVVSGQIADGGELLSRLNEAGTARGLITIVVATATVVAALVLVLAAITAEGAESDVKMRLSEGRQVLAPLIGILGTVVGFYFGQAPASSGQSLPGGAQALRVEAVATSAEQVRAGGTLVITGTVAGGRAPYEYTITLPDVGQPVRGKLTAAGELKQEVTIPQDAKPQSVTVQIQVKDAAGATIEARAERPVKVGSS